MFCVIYKKTSTYLIYPCGSNFERLQLLFQQLRVTVPKRTTFEKVKEKNGFFNKWRKKNTVTKVTKLLLIAYKSIEDKGKVDYSYWRPLYCSPQISLLWLLEHCRLNISREYYRRNKTSFAFCEGNYLIKNKDMRPVELYLVSTEKKNNNVGASGLSILSSLPFT